MNKLSLAAFVLLGLSFSTSSQAGSISQLIYQVPEPSSIGLVGLAIAALLTNRLNK